MKIRSLLPLAVLAGCLAASSAVAETSVNVSIGIGAPPPPVVVVRQEPRVILVPGSAVYVVNDDRWGYDCFHYGVYWYAYRDGWWYRSRAWRGPFIAVRAAGVPRAIISVPANRWKHHPHGMPPGQAKKNSAVYTGRQYPVQVRPLNSGPPSRGRDNDRGHEKGRGGEKEHGRGGGHGHK